MTDKMQKRIVDGMFLPHKKNFLKNLVRIYFYIDSMQVRSDNSESILIDLEILKHLFNRI
jgi:hypothetical protein